MIDVIQKLQSIFDDHKDQRICAVGGTCVGKSTLLKAFPSALDMDKIVFPKLTEEERVYVCQTPWSSAIGERMSELAKKYVVILPGYPVFGTILLPCDLIVHLTIGDDALRLRTEKRQVNFEDAKNMQRKIKQQLLDIQIPVIEISVD